MEENLEAGGAASAEVAETVDPCRGSGQNDLHPLCLADGAIHELAIPHS